MPHFLNPNVFRADEKARAPPAQALTKSGGRCRSSIALVSMAVASYSSLQVRGHRGRGSAAAARCDADGRGVPRRGTAGGGGGAAEPGGGRRVEVGACAL